MIQELAGKEFWLEANLGSWQAIPLKSRHLLNSEAKDIYRNEQNTSYVLVILMLLKLGFGSNIFQCACKAAKINSLVSFSNWRCPIFISIFISTEVLEQASMFVELEIVPKGFHYHMFQFASEAAIINFK